MNTIEIIGKYFPVRKRDIGQYSFIKSGHITYNIESYFIEGVGHLCIMSEKFHKGVVRLYSVILTPIEIDAPIFIYSLRFLPFRRKLRLELFDTQINPKMEYPSLQRIKNINQDIETIYPQIYWNERFAYSENFYATVSKKKEGLVDKISSQYLEEYCKILKSSYKCDAYFKKLRNDLYIEDSLKNGSPRRDNLLKTYDITFISFLYHSIIFGIESQDKGK